MHQRSVGGIVFLAFAFLPLAVSAQPIRVSYVGTTGTNVPLWVMQEAGLLKKHGLATDLILISGGSTIIQALLAQEIAFATISGPAVIQARLQGADVVIIGSPYNLMPYSLVVHASIRSPNDLKGKRVAIARFGGITEVAARLAFDKLGLSPKEVTMTQTGPDGQRLAAVQSGAVAGTLVGPPGTLRSGFAGTEGDARSRRSRRPIPDGNDCYEPFLSSSESASNETVFDGVCRGPASFCRSQGLCPEGYAEVYKVD